MMSWVNVVGYVPTFVHLDQEAVLLLPTWV
jgi:hypothetical protein